MPQPSEPAGSGSTQPFGALVRQKRREQGWSLRDLGDNIRFNRGYIGHVEKGEKFPHRRFAELADSALGCSGTLTEVWELEAEDRKRSELVGRLLTASVTDSLRLIATTDERLTSNDIDIEVDRLAIAYMGNAPAPMLQEAVSLRSEILHRLRYQNYQSHDLAGLYVALGHVQGVLAYAALDLGNADAASTHIEAAWTCAERADDDALRSWVRGTQSLVARFQANYGQALEYVRDGLRYPASGAGRIRLLCGMAQCHANLGDSAGTNSALDTARDERDRLSTPDTLGGIFEFSVAKQHYYASSSLIWLDGKGNAERAAQEATEAITRWKSEPPETRSLDDEALAQVYQGTAHLQLGDLDAAAIAVRPILDLPPERQISWIKKRLDRLGSLLRAAPFHGAASANDLYGEIRNVVT
ncbi:MAG: helix-turn-helix transcriptional regulator [Actinobacteria bacterium]|nr:helix-turn-helix transcriptional regulator [Actinomycetota bacterium]MBI3686281.1 helix-turn-helix transcriptional regulator [Actinomycetota bacterium]